MWEGSDLDVVAITSDEKSTRDVFVLIENGIIFHCEVISRSQSRRYHERMLRGSIPHQIYTTGKLMYSIDDSLQDFYQELNGILTELLEAFDAKDSVLIGDLMEYEVAPRLEQLQTFLQEVA